MTGLEQQYIETISSNTPAISQAFIDFYYWDTALKTTYVEPFLESRKPLRSVVTKNRTEKFVCKQCGNEYDYIRTSRSQEAPAECESCKKAESLRMGNAYSKEREQRAEELQKLKTMPYKEYLQTEHWQSFRKRVLRYHGYRCQLCGADKTQLNVHHRSYENRGQEQYNDVIVLCHDCHSKFHGKVGC